MCQNICPVRVGHVGLDASVDWIALYWVWFSKNWNRLDWIESELLYYVIFVTNAPTRLSKIESRLTHLIKCKKLPFYNNV